ncbi:MAG: histidine kinase, partial [Flavobacteriales bacterium]
VYAATADNGILVFDSDTIRSQWNISTGLISNRLYRLQVQGNRIVISTDVGVQILDSDGRSLHVIQGADGLASDKVSDFELFENELWVVHGKGVQKVNLNELNHANYKPTLEIQKLTVNDSLNVSLSQSQFDVDQQKFSFDLSVHNLRYQKGIKYEYKLEGADKRWQLADYSDHIINYQSLSSGDYTFRARAVCRGERSKEVPYSFTIATPFYMAWWFYALVSLGLMFLLALWFKSRLNRQAFLAEQQNELNASKLTAIQSQMNPHFIFNALNSIQDLVLKGDVTNSYTYITKFADLVRRTLNYSDKDFIDFENEIKLIELYLTLEKLRFKTNFEFTIDEKGVEDIQLPPMLIQPFIENALVHGLLHREGEKKLSLKFELEENLICTITDNGVGREKAKEIKERQRASHESFSVNAIKRRFEILQRNFGGELGFTTEDLGENGVAIGTRVKLVIPVKRKF